MIKVFTHTDLDGIICGWLLKRYYEEYCDVEVQYCNYDRIDENVERFISSGAIKYYTNVIITDISVNENTAETIELFGDDKFELIDHHINETTAHFNKHQWCLLNGELDGEVRSATYLVAKEYGLLGKSTFIDDLVQRVDNWDTWKWKEKEDMMAKNMNDLFYTLGRDRFLEMLDEQYENQEKFIIEDKYQLLLDLRQEEYERYLYQARKNIKFIQYKGYSVGVLFNDRYTSELGNDLAEEYEDLDFVALINFKTGISLRGVKDNLHLGDIAKELGESLGLPAGGHMKSSGCTFTDDFRETTINKLFSL